MSIILVVIGIAAVVLLYFLLKKPAFNPPPPRQLITSDLTLQQLKQYNGESKAQILIAIKDTIYDVSGVEYYRKNGPYDVFAGHDASINLSKMSHDPLFLNKWGSFTLTPEQTKILNDWEAQFQRKYRKVGNVQKQTQPSS